MAQTAHEYDDDALAAYNERTGRDGDTDSLFNCRGMMSEMHLVKKAY